MLRSVTGRLGCGNSTGWGSAVADSTHGSGHGRAAVGGRGACDPGGLAGADLGASTRHDGIVLCAVPVGVEELLEPLDELKVVLEAALDESVNGHDLKGESGGGCDRKNSGKKNERK